MSPKRKKREEEEASVEMSSLIDCVFLLLIFFLVTTMMKKLEKQIPVMVPDNGSAIASKADSQRQVLGIDAKGKYFYASGRMPDGRPRFLPLSNLENYIDKLAERAEKNEEVNIRLYADEDVEFQKVIEILDKLQMKKLDKVDVRMRDLRSDRWYVPGQQEREAEAKKAKYRTKAAMNAVGDAK